MVLFAVAVAFAGCGESESARAAEAPRIDGRLNGITLEAPRREIDDRWVTPLESVHAEWVAIVPYAFCRADEGRVIYRREGRRGWWGEQPDGVRMMVQQAHDRGLKVMIKPQIWFRGAWAGDFKLETDEQWDQWESDYTAYLDILLEIAREFDVEMVCLGTELRHSFNGRSDYWKGLIEKARQGYSGKLTIASNWDNYENIAFWDRLDFIGVDAYFPLSQEVDPALEKLWELWHPICKRLEKFATKAQKPVLFTEYGYRSLDQCTWNTWEKDHNHRDLPVNLQAQATALQALYQCFWPKPWFAGGFLWEYQANHDRAGGPEDKSYTPQNKPAEEIVRLAYQNFK